MCSGHYNSQLVCSFTQIPQPMARIYTLCRSLQNFRLLIWYAYLILLLSQVAARSKAWVCGRPSAGIVCSNPAGGSEVCLLWVLSCQVQASATGWPLVQSSPTECGLCLSVILKPGPAPLRAVVPRKKKIVPSYSLPLSRLHFLYFSFSTFLTLRRLVILTS